MKSRSRSEPFCSQFKIHNSLFTIHYSLFTIHYSPFVIHNSAFTPLHFVAVADRRTSRKPSRKLSLENRLLLMALAAALPAMLVSMVLLWRGDYTAKTQWTLTVVIAGVWLGFAFSLRERIVRPLQTLSNILAALREEDYSIRARGARRDEALGEVMIEVNALGDTLKEQRSEEHTSELQSRFDLVCRLLLEKKNTGAARFGVGDRRDLG